MRNRIRNILIESIDFEDRPNINDNFWKWFGGSMVIERDGYPEPTTKYHGGTITDNSFDLNRVQFGFHFGTKEHANRILDMDKIESETNEYKLNSNVGFYYLKIERPLRLNFDMGHWIEIERWVELGYLPEQWFDMDDDGNLCVKEGERLEDLFIEQGYDGIIYPNDLEGVGKSYIVFYPTHIKSIHNDGTWNPNDSDVMK
jgi:hypothetical protein